MTAGALIVGLLLCGGMGTIAGAWAMYKFMVDWMPRRSDEFKRIWYERYLEVLLELRKVNKGAQRLRKKLDVTRSKLTRAGRPLEEREAPHCPTCSCGVPGESHG